jgi:3'(2'), 5'-bisphosphate nucleotidase
MDLRAELATAERAARAAGDIVRAHYERGGLPVETKADRSPVTQADRDANTAILEILAEVFPADAILSEESPDTDARLGNRRVWIIDPLDGTKDFVNRSGEFAVHVGFAVDGRAVVGVVHVPMAGTSYAACTGHGAWRVVGEARTRLHASRAAELGGLRIGTSRQLPSPPLVAFLDAHGIAQRVAMGASTKLVAVAAGELDAVINLSSGELEWDTCAPEVIVREAGGAYTDGTGAPFRYNQPDPTHRRGSIASNGACHAALVAALAPYVPA